MELWTYHGSRNGGESGLARANAADTDFGAQHFGRHCSAQDLFSLGTVLDGFQLLFGCSDRRAALCGRKAHQVGGSIDIDLS